MSRRVSRVVAALLFTFVFFSLQPFYRDAPLKVISHFNRPAGPVEEEAVDAPVEAPPASTPETNAPPSPLPWPPKQPVAPAPQLTPMPEPQSLPPPPRPIHPGSHSADGLSTHHHYYDNYILDLADTNPRKFTKDPELMAKYKSALQQFYDTLDEIRVVIQKCAVQNRRRLKNAKFQVPGVKDDQYNYDINYKQRRWAKLLASNLDHTPADEVQYRNRSKALKQQFWNRTELSDTTPFPDLPYWMANDEVIKADHGMQPPTAGPPLYHIWRSLRDYNAPGDGIHDATDGINMAIQANYRCASLDMDETCRTTEQTPAVVYIPPGTYLISSPIDILYNTQLVGDPLDPPTILVSSAFVGYAAIRTTVDDAHVPLGHAMRSVRNIVIDLTNAPADNSVMGIYWEAAQSSDLRNIDIYMRNNSDAAAAQTNTQIGLYFQNGRGCFLSDIYLQGGRVGAHINVEHFTVSNMIVADAQTAVVVPGRSRVGLDHLHGLTVVSAPGTHARSMRDDHVAKPDVAVGVAIDAIAASYILRGSLVLSDSVFVNVAVAISQVGYPNSNVDADHVEYKPHATTVLLRGKPGGTLSVPAWKLSVSKHEVVDKVFKETEIVEDRPVSLTVLTPGSKKSGSKTKASGSEDNSNRSWFSDWWDWWQGKLGNEEEADDHKEEHERNMLPWVTRRLPSYTDGHYEFVSVRDFGAAGDGKSDDTAALNEALESAAASGKVLFFPYGVYVVTNTVHIPVNSRIVGQAWATMEGRGSRFSWNTNYTAVKTEYNTTRLHVESQTLVPVVQVGRPGDHGVVEISDMAIALEEGRRALHLIEWNVGVDIDKPKGGAAMWNCHIRVPVGVAPLKVMDGSSAYLENVGVSIVKNKKATVLQDANYNFDLDDLPEEGEDEGEGERSKDRKDSERSEDNKEDGERSEDDKEHFEAERLKKVIDIWIKKSNREREHFLKDILIDGRGPAWVWGHGSNTVRLLPTAEEKGDVFLSGGMLKAVDVKVTMPKLKQPKQPKKGRFGSKGWAELEEAYDDENEHAQ
ncbi:hypothetical protein Sste5346_005288 [Sporothrix stenoceras]|uniref:Rhamnogalacturonase A/B/Epimerase-like pectate lyase domain-containing protein n=1 Tax=Sporothrix stenoceras TaxID=5173 RepID=A0ABR3Z4C3_9PEZI